MRAVAILFIMSAVVLGAYAINKGHLQKMTDHCKQGVENGHLDARCVKFCVATLIRLMNSNGDIDENFIKNAIRLKGMPEEEKTLVHARIEKCFHEAKRSNPCETAGNAFDCFLQKEDQPNFN